MASDGPQKISERDNHCAQDTISLYIISMIFVMCNPNCGITSLRRCKKQLFKEIEGAFAQQFNCAWTVFGGH